MREGILLEGGSTNIPSSTGSSRTVTGKGHHTINPFRSIKGRLLLFSLCILLIPIAVITTVYYLTARNTLERQTLAWLSAIAESRKAHLLKFVEGRKRMAEVHSADIGAYKDFKPLKRLNAQSLLIQPSSLPTANTFGRRWRR